MSNLTLALMTGVLSLCSTPLVRAQVLSEALTSFPSRTDFIEYDNLAGLRALPNYETLRQRFAGKPLEHAKAALWKLNIEEDQVDELVLGSSPDAIYGIVSGTFNGSQATKFALKHHLLPLPVEDNQIFCPGTGTCVAFLEDEIAAFGNPTELKTMLQTRLGIVAQLSSNRPLVNLMNDTQTRALVRGVAVGTKIQSVAESSLPDLSAFHMNWSVLSAAINMFGYSVDLDTKAHLTASLQCNSPATAFILRQMLTAMAAAQAFDNLQVFSTGNNIDVKMDTLLTEPTGRN